MQIGMPLNMIRKYEGNINNSNYLGFMCRWLTNSSSVQVKL